MMNLILMSLCVTVNIIGSEPTRKHIKDVGARIVGGVALDIEKAPYQVSIQRTRHFCGGALISKQHVLTSAHCLVNKTITDLKVRVGSSTWKDGGELINVISGEMHPQYTSEDIDYDVAVLMLAKKITNAKSKEIIMATKNPKPGINLLVTGWGTANAEDKYPVDNLMSVSLPLWSNEECKKALLQEGVHNTENMICAGFKEGGKSPCKGDSGGPAVHNNRLFGIVTFGIGCAEPNVPSVFMSVPKYQEWITEAMHLLVHGK